MAEQETDLGFRRAELITGTGVYGSSRTVTIDQDGLVEFEFRTGGVDGVVTRVGRYFLPSRKLSSIAASLRGLGKPCDPPGPTSPYTLSGKIDGREFHFAADPYNIPLLTAAAQIGGLANAEPQP